MATTEQQTSADPVFDEVPGHGNTPAAWIMFLIIFIGFVVSCVAFTIPNWVLFWAGGVVVVLGLVVGGILKAAGFGVGGKRTKGH
ncbi:MAG: HGxxPAAW family protein [Galactobacter sp.]|uniref:HGxxPAAW family protein n=1 Tax=Galactobacter sp. TaxID=2676125 RepID=UPI0025C1A4FE|nr:HGxxPAAW family protein [Galactobacter sp.]